MRGNLASPDRSASHPSGRTSSYLPATTWPGPARAGNRGGACNGATSQRCVIGKSPASGAFERAQTASGALTEAPSTCKHNPAVEELYCKVREAVMKPPRPSVAARGFALLGLLASSLAASCTFPSVTFEVDATADSGPVALVDATNDEQTVGAETGGGTDGTVGSDAPTGCGALSTTANCGSCGNVCGGSTPVCAAEAGTFACAALCPPSAPTACNGSCVNTMTDPNNCGTCGSTCSTDAGNAIATCAGGTCASDCAGGFNLCNGACVDYASTANCGQCGHACTGTASLCASTGGAYSCLTECPTGSTNCSGSCVDTTSTATNCGQCGRVCTTADPNAQPACINSACTVSCNQGYTLCNGACVELTTAANCGACGHACNADDGPVCAPGDAGAYACVSGCTASAPSLCGGTCVDTTKDTGNCGTCGNSCSTGVANSQPDCVNSACGFSCDSPYTACRGACVDTTSDNNNCGSCGHACTAEAGSPVCSGSTCLSGCPSSTPALCEGTCVDTGTNVSNCGSCGKVCTTGVANAQATCVSSTCGFACKTSYTACNGACVDEQTDTANCGGCGSAFACAAGQICQSGACECSASACPACSALLVACCTSSNECGCSTLGILDCK
jgi:hypothetical protein